MSSTINQIEIVIEKMASERRDQLFSRVEAACDTACRNAGMSTPFTETAFGDQLRDVIRMYCDTYRPEFVQQVIREMTTKKSDARKK